MVFKITSLLICLIFVPIIMYCYRILSLEIKERYRIPMLNVSERMERVSNPHLTPGFLRKMFNLSVTRISIEGGSVLTIQYSEKEDGLDRLIVRYIKDGKVGKSTEIIASNDCSSGEKIIAWPREVEKKLATLNSDIIEFLNLQQENIIRREIKKEMIEQGYKVVREQDVDRMIDMRKIFS